jgi:hypothetical protein
MSQPEIRETVENDDSKKAKTRLETICKLLGPSFQGEKVS